MEHQLRRAAAGLPVAAILAATAACGRPAPTPARSDSTVAVAPPARADSAVVAPLTVRVLDVGQGDATLITNGESRVLVDGGPSAERMGELLDSLHLNDSTIDVVVLTHPHADHLAGLRELFRTQRRIRVRFFFENRDPSPGTMLARLRDSVNARARRGELVIRDTDDPCGDGRPVCTITLRGGARLHVMRPDPHGDDANERSTPLKLVGPDSASFTMWLAGDAEREATAWFDSTDYDVRPGMDVDVLKADHHGSCNGTTSRYLQLTTPRWVIASLAARNEYGHMHAQTKAMLRAAGVPWYRTDRNGTVTITSPGTPGGGFTITPSRGESSADGRSDRRSTQDECSG
ncbi:MAG TPA: MBL fold metallo-hydrolase [Gemmatimonadaceae bacterium]|nr:MBL fold metallo-hydrolase [Gemmatimonadaceae bacterium]